MRYIIQRFVNLFRYHKLNRIMSANLYMIILSRKARQLREVCLVFQWLRNLYSLIFKVLYQQSGQHSGCFFTLSSPNVMFTDVGLQDFPHHDAASVVSFQVRCKLEVLALSSLYWKDDLSQITIQTNLSYRKTFVLIS